MSLNIQGKLLFDVHTFANNKLKDKLIANKDTMHIKLERDE